MSREDDKKSLEYYLKGILGRDLTKDELTVLRFSFADGVNTGQSEIFERIKNGDVI